MNKINYNKWLFSTIKYSEYRNIDIINFIFNDILTIVNNYSDIDFVNSDSLFDNLCVHFYNEYVHPYKQINIDNSDNIDDKDYIESYCEQDIIDTFIYYKNNFNIFPNISSSYPLLLFIVNNCCVYEINTDDENSDIDDDYY